MKRNLILFAACLFAVGAVAQISKPWRMAVISDIHVMAPELLKQDGEAFQNYVAHDRKLLKEGPEILDSAIVKIQEAKPQVVLVTGDLTKDGEKVSHLQVAQQYLKKLKDSGCKVYVIPGNHDVNNPHAVYFLGDTVQRTTTVSATEFAEIYKDYGYGEAIARDDNSLSYVVQLTPYTRLLAIDACEYEDNDYTKNTCVTAGRIKPETMDFIREQVKEADSKGQKMLVMMHHGLVQHWKWQDKVMSEYLIDEWEKYSKEFGKLGLNVVFTGHFHSQDISSKGKGDNVVYDIETGSTVSYPQPFRIIDFTDKGMKITTRHIDKISDSSAGLNEKAMQYAKSGISTIVLDILPKKIPMDVQRQAADVLGDAYVVHLAGDETQSAEFKERLKMASKQVRKYSWKYAFILNKLGKYFTTDLKPEDNELTIYKVYK